MHCVVKLKATKLVLKGWLDFIVLNIQQILYLSRMVPLACQARPISCMAG